MNLVKVKLLEKISPYEKNQEIEMRADLAFWLFSEKVEILEENKDIGLIPEESETIEEEILEENKDIEKAGNKAILKNKKTKDVE